MSSSTPAICKIHVNNSTKMSLNDRFTVFSSQPTVTHNITTNAARRRSRSLDRVAPVAAADRIGSIANRRLLQQLARKHKMMTALKLKRRSMKPGASMAYRRATNGVALKRGSLKAFRLAPSGNPMKANSLTNVATMKADLLGRRPLRRSNSIASLAGRLVKPGGGGGVGGAARRVAKRRLARTTTQRAQRPTPDPRRRSRSRSRARAAAGRALTPTNSVNAAFARGRRSNSRAVNRQQTRGRSRSRSRSRLANTRTPSKKRVPITSRLGVKPGVVAAGKPATQLSQNGKRGRRSGSLSRVAQGRIQKRRNSTRSLRTFRQNSTVRGAAASRARSAVRPLAVAPAGQQKNNRVRGGRAPSIRGGGRSRSRSRNRLIKQQRGSLTTNIQTERQQSVSGGFRRGGRSRGRNQPRGRIATAGTQRNGNGQQQERRGRSRSRGRGNVRGTGGGRQLGNSSKNEVRREDLDKELDQYMATTKTENDMDYLLRN